MPDGIIVTGTETIRDGFKIIEETFEQRTPTGVVRGSGTRRERITTEPHEAGPDA